jgi:3-hydroxy-9,10-secoandrosta-1,3,5(10)-triene-9,17-dione monooxygenase
MPDHSQVDLNQALARTRALVPELRARADAQDRARALLPETAEAIRASGLVRYQMPKRWGGMELDFPAVVEVPTIIAHGCASTSWDFHAFANHSWLLATYDPGAQEEVWGDDPDVLIAAGIAFPQGRGRKVDGGYVISGHWNFCSGVGVSPWTMLAATVYENDSARPVDYRMCIVRRGEFEVIDDWQVMGMRGTGSQSSRVTDLFVPEHRALSMLTIRGGNDFPGARANPGALFRVPIVAAAGYFPAPTAVGTADAMLALVMERIGGKDSLQSVQLRVAHAAAKLEAARALMRADTRRLWDDACAGRIADVLTKLEYKRNAAYVIQSALEAVDTLHAIVAAEGLYDGDPIQRVFRDAHSIAAHISGSFDAQGSAWGASALGTPVNNPML